MKRTPEDEVFAADFGRELKVHYDHATQKSAEGPGMSDEQFAATLDVTRPALKKYLGGAATPALRVVVLAFLRYGINVPYWGTPLFGKRKTRGAAGTTEAQLVLPFAVQGLNAISVRTKIQPKGENRFELRVNLRKAC